MTKKIIVRPSAGQERMVDETLRELSEMPEMGSSQRFNHPRLQGVRKWRVHDFEKHLIFYRPVENGIEILRILYASRDIAAVLEE